MLRTIRADLVRTDDIWQEWNFWQFLETFRKWTDRNLIPSEDKRKLNPTKRERLYQRSQDDWSEKACLYCSNEDHKSSDCKIIAKAEVHKEILSEKKLCFNCIGVKHRVAECRSKRTCQTCKGKHHWSLCRQLSTMMVATEGSVIYYVVVVKVNNITCRALLDTGPGSSYASSALPEKLKKQMVRKETKRIKMMMYSTVRTVRKVDVFEVEIKYLGWSLQFRSEVSNVERETLLSLSNPNYKTVLK